MKGNIVMTKWNGLELPESYFHDDAVYIIKGDACQILPQIPNKSIDLVLCDLPYGVTARNKWDNKLPLDILWQEWWRHNKDNAPVVLTATEPFSSELVMSQKQNFRYGLIWSKPMATGFLNANRMPLRSHEQILVFYRKLPTYNPQKTDGKPYKMTRRGDTTNYNEVGKLHWETNSDGKRFPKSVVEFAWDKAKLHPTQKPEALFSYLIKIGIVR